MTRRTRKILFYIAVFIFIGASYIAVLYAQGYKYSFAENKFFRTGAISLKVNTDAKVFFQDKLIGSTSFLGNTVGINRLLPGQYTIRLQKDNYSIWEKTVTVQEGLVAEFPRILLLPQGEEESAKLLADIDELMATPSPSPSLSPKPKPTKVSPSPSPSATPTPNQPPFYLKNKVLYRTTATASEVMGQNVFGFQLTENNKKIVWWTNNEIWVMWLDDTSYQPYHKNGDRELITRFITPIKNVAWYPDDDHIVVQTNAYRIVEIDNRGGTNIVKI